MHPLFAVTNGPVARLRSADSCQSCQRLKLLLPIQIIFIIFVLVLLPRPTAAQDNTSLSIEVRAGFDGYYKPNYAVPMTISAQNDGPPIEGEIRIITGNPSFNDEVVYSVPISLPTQSNRQIALTVYLSRFTGSLTAQLVDSNGAIIAEQDSNTLNQLAVDDLLYGVVSSSPGELAFLESVSGGRSQAGVAFLNPAELADIAVAWDALDVLIFDDTDTSQLTPAQLSALSDWLAGGGHLVVTGGPNWQATTAALGDLLPVTVSSTASLDDLPALRDFAGMEFRDPAPYLVADSTLREGELLLHEDGLPIVAMREQGRGRVYFLALDPKLAPLVDWDGSGLLWGLIADAVPLPTAWEMGVQDSYAAGTAVSDIPSLSLPSIGQLLLFLLIYIIVIGPLNYLVLRRLNRRELAWITIPALVLLFSGFTYFTSFRTRGENIIVNEMTVAYGQIGGERVHAQSLVGIYSPRRNVFDITLPGEAAVRPFSRALGSLSSGGNLDAIVREGDVRLANIRTDTSEMQTFIAESYQPAPEITVHIQPVEGGTTGEVEIGVENQGERPLEDAALLIGTTLEPVGTLQPGEGRVLTITLPETGSSSLPPEGGTPLFNPSSASPAPLLGAPAAVLGGRDFMDLATFPRWQLLQAISGSANLSNAGSAWPEDRLTLVGWMDGPQLEAAANKGQIEQLGTTLYFLEIGE